MESIRPVVMEARPHDVKKTRTNAMQWHAREHSITEHAPIIVRCRLCMGKVSRLPIKHRVNYIISI